ncbi:cysteine hydrolase [Patescibacteria group bacterium]|nr:cysteine hydrolase [Patescibacteria group bacterium]
MNSSEFIIWLDDWCDKLKLVDLSKVVSDPEKSAIVSVDVINGFCHDGPLASPRIKKIITPILSLFKKAYKAGVRNFVLLQDNHDANATEFSTYPPHCRLGTKESETVPELKKLPFADKFVIVPKNSISPSFGTHFNRWLETHKSVDTFIVVGDCTDICVYLLSLHLKVYADAYNLKRKVIVPADCVDTFDTPVRMAKKLNIMPHDAEFLHKVFLYHMKLNGLEVVKSLT